MIPIKLSASCPGKHQQQQQQQQPSMQLSGGNPRLNQLCARWQQVWLLALDRQRKLNDALDRQEEVTPFFKIVNHLKSDGLIIKLTGLETSEETVKEPLC